MALTIQLPEHFQHLAEQATKDAGSWTNKHLCQVQSLSN